MTCGERRVKAVKRQSRRWRPERRGLAAPIANGILFTVIMRDLAPFALVVAVTAPSFAFADTLVLRDGQTFEGIVSVEGAEVSIELDIGTVTFPKEEVERIERADSAVHEFDRRFANVRRNDVKALQSLADWARAQGLDSRAYTLHAMVVAQAPENETSRRALGHQRMDGQWVDPAEQARSARLADIKRRSEQLRAEAAEEERDRLMRQRAQQLAQLLIRERQAAAAPPPPTIWDWGPAVWGLPCGAVRTGFCGIRDPGRILIREPAVRRRGRRVIRRGGPVVYRGGSTGGTAKTTRPGRPADVATGGSSREPRDGARIAIRRRR